MTKDNIYTVGYRKKKIILNIFFWIFFLDFILFISNKPSYLNLVLVVIIVCTVKMNYVLSIFRSVAISYNYNFCELYINPKSKKKQEKVKIYYKNILKIEILTSKDNYQVFGSGDDSYSISSPGRIRLYFYLNDKSIQVAEFKDKHIIDKKDLTVFINFLKANHVKIIKGEGYD